MFKLIRLEIYFRVSIKKARKPTQPRLSFDLKKLRVPNVADTFQASLISLRDDDISIVCTIMTCNKAVTDHL